MRTTLLKDGHVVTPDGVQKMDVVLKDGVIDHLGPELDFDAEVVIDCSGLHIMPGIIDAHVHFRTPGDEEKEDWNTGSRAAAKGGVTTVFDMPNTRPICASTLALDQKRGIATRDSLVNFGFFATVTEENVSHITDLKNIAGVKVYMGKSTGNLCVGNPLLEKLFKAGPRLIAVHAEDEELMEENMKKFQSMSDPELHSVIRSVEVAYRAAKNAIDMAAAYEVPLHICHMSTGEELIEVRNAKQRGQQVTCEVCPHHLFLTTDSYAKWGNFVRMNPPLRDAAHKKALWEDGMGLGVVDMVATDHAPHLREEKEKGYWDAPSGVPGVQVLLPLLLNEHHKGRLSLEKIVELTAAAPARIYGVRGKGELRQGADADVVIVDLKKVDEVRDEDQESKCGWSPYTGMTLHGWPVVTIVGGEVVYQEGKFHEDVRGTEVTFQDT